jgi:carbamoyl-phosphate synthase large subunit
MRSVGEVAAISEVYEEALLSSWLSVQGNDMPGEAQLILIYNPDRRGQQELELTRRILEQAGYQTITLKGMEVGDSMAVDERRALELIAKGDVGMVITTGYAPEKDYKVRRQAADLNIPLVLNHKLALELAKAIKAVKNKTITLRDMRSYWRDWKDIIGVI